MTQLLLLVHVVVGAALLGALTHQSLSVARGAQTAPARGFRQRFQSVSSPSFTNAVVVLFALSVVLGGLLYPRYRIDVRPILEDLQLSAANGLFETKEHFGAVGLGVLPVYWVAWRPKLAVEWASTRKYLTWILAALAWFNFLVGELLNNIRGMFP
ncbi:MAG: hypothetical protein IT184_02735 [Acidobacteria bacterium]|nr:hypothetical protein [Acidobacteriota bacterium]